MPKAIAWERLNHADTDLGPLASFPHREHVERYVEIGRKEGATVVAGGARPTGGIFDKGAFYPATVLTDVDNSARVCREEIFGPVAVVLPFENEDDLMRQANDTDFGLASGIWTGDYQKAWRVARGAPRWDRLDQYLQAGFDIDSVRRVQAERHRPREGFAGNARLHRDEGHFLGIGIVPHAARCARIRFSLRFGGPPADGRNAFAATTR